MIIGILSSSLRPASGGATIIVFIAFPCVSLGWQAHPPRPHSFASIVVVVRWGGHQIFLAREATNHIAIVMIVRILSLSLRPASGGAAIIVFSSVALVWQAYPPRPHSFASIVVIVRWWAHQFFLARKGTKHIAIVMIVCILSSSLRPALGAATIIAFPCVSLGWQAHPPRPHSFASIVVVVRWWAHQFFLAREATNHIAIVVIVRILSLSLRPASGGAAIIVFSSVALVWQAHPPRPHSYASIVVIIRWWAHQIFLAREATNHIAIVVIVRILSLSLRPASGGAAIIVFSSVALVWQAHPPRPHSYGSIVVIIRWWAHQIFLAREGKKQIAIVVIVRILSSSLRPALGAATIIVFPCSLLGSLAHPPRPHSFTSIVVIVRWGGHQIFLGREER
jgi:hypothetical protein